MSVDSTQLSHAICTVTFQPSLSLTPVEHKVLTFLTVGLQTAQIANLLNLSSQAVTQTIRRLKTKTDSNNWVELGRKTLEYELVSTNDIKYAQQIVMNNS